MLRVVKRKPETGVALSSLCGKHSTCALDHRGVAALVTLDDVRQAQQCRDPAMVPLLLQLLDQDDEQGDQAVPDHAYTFPKFFSEIQSRPFRKKSLEQQRVYRQQRIAELESADTAAPLPDRFRSHEVLWELWQAGDSFSRRCLLELIANVPIVYGPWKGLKRIFKEAEQVDDTVVYGAIAARLDMALHSGEHGVSKKTLGYLCRRSWRYLRRLGETLPACYPDVASDFLKHYEETYHLQSSYMHSWVLNHIFFHQTREYSGTKFLFGRYDRKKGYVTRPTSWLKHRAFAEAWRRSPRPLFALLQEAKCEAVRQFAAAALKADFRAALRDVEPAWVVRLVAAGSGSIDEFVIWILENVPRLEQAKFRELGLHDAVLQLFHSKSSKACQFAADYARTHARDLPIDQLLRLVGIRHKAVRSLALDLLKSRQPRDEVGLEAWGRLLDYEHGAKLAGEMLHKHFGAAELTAEWFAERLLSRSDAARSFAIDSLAKLHPPKKLGSEYFVRLIAQTDPSDWSHSQFVSPFACQQLEKIGLAQLDSSSLKHLLLHPATQGEVIAWVEQGLLKPTQFTAEFLKSVAYHPSWESDPVVVELKKGPHGDAYRFHPELSAQILQWLQDVRHFSPDQLGFEWLMELVRRSEPRYHDFAVETMSKAFLPADFATQDPAAETEKASEPSEEIHVDLGGASFVFTGKLATMTRSEAQNKVTTAGGANSNSVTKKLDYLVIGDDGSPLYGQGRKGSKQLKGESLIEEGAGLKIISETAFLQMLAGEQRQFSDDAVEAGCAKLWQMMTDAENEDDALARFARTYIRRHHPDICLKETDRPVDPGAEIPAEFLSFDRLKPLFRDSRGSVRSLAMELARYEFAAWNPPIEGVVEMCESPFPEVRQFVATSLTCEDLPDNRRFRLDPEVLTADAVYSFCESRDAETRALGMKLIEMHPRLKLPEELFRLTESPDGQVRAFAIRTFWSLYRDRGISNDWKPHYRPKSTVGTKKKPLTAEQVEARIGSGAPPRPDALPAQVTQIESLLRNVLYELPPPRPPRDENRSLENIVKLRRLPARQAKLQLVETIRDLAIEDVEFAAVVSPLLCEFMNSRGKSEQAACLVAVTRIRAAHGPAGTHPEQTQDVES